MVGGPNDKLDDVLEQSVLDTADGFRVPSILLEHLASIWPEQNALLYWNSGLDLRYAKRLRFNLGQLVGNWWLDALGHVAAKATAPELLVDQLVRLGSPV